MEYRQPLTLAEALTLLRDEVAPVHILAGGSDLIPTLKPFTGQSATLLDVKKIPELQTFSIQADGSAVIGAALPFVMIQESQALAKVWPGFHEAAAMVGSRQIQSRATLGGNICHGSPAADTVPPLIAAGAQCRICHASGERMVPINEVITSPGKTCLRDGEILVSVHLPARPTAAADAYLRVSPRGKMDISLAGVAVNLVLDEAGSVAHCQVALGAVAPVAFAVSETADFLADRSVDQAMLTRLQRTVRQACRPMDDVRATAEYRTHVTGILAVRGFERALNRIRVRQAGGPRS
jgi:carbon-monoxide dehydrogenase medium subunit